MSAENFIKVFKDKRSTIEGTQEYLEYKDWVASNKTWFNKNRKELEGQGLSKVVGLVVTEDTANALGVSQQFKALFDKVQANLGDGGIRVDVIKGVPTILFPDVPFDKGIERTLDKYLGEGTAAKAKELSYIKGHIFGFMTGAIQGATEELHSLLSNTGTAKRPKLPMMNEEEADYALNFLHILVKHLQKLDLDSATYKTVSNPLTLKYNKSAEHFLIELQLEAENAASAKLIQTLAGQKGGKTGIRALINPGSIQQAALNGIMAELIKNGTFSPKELAEFKSSPSVNTLITDKMAAALGKKKEFKDSYSARVKLPVSPVQIYVNKKAKLEYRSKLKKTIEDAKVNIAKLRTNKQKVKRTIRGQTLNLVNLQILMDRHLQDVVAANMGNGSDSRVLNYRTGRLAASAKVERLSASREGMITAFYSYMRNPYGTFSDGGKQQYPKTRDPKALIGNSIREIAATVVGNRLRAVLV